MTDEQLIEAMARAMFKDDQLNRLDIAKAALAVARPIIEAQERERLAAMFDALSCESLNVTDIAYMVRNMAAIRGRVIGALQNEKIEALEAELEKTKRFYIEAGFELRQLREDNKQLWATVKTYADRVSELKAALHDIYEVYSGSEGCIAVTYHETYLKLLVNEMGRIAAKHKRAAAAAIRSDGND